MKIKLGVFMGGRSVEHEISIVTALQAINAFDKEKYEVVPVYIAKTGEMYTGDALLDIDNYRDLKKLVITATRVVPVSEGDEILLMKYPPVKIFGNNEVNRIQIAFPIVHGTNVEDGTLQGFFELYNIPYVGCDVMSSAIGMDKVIMKKVLKDEGISIVDYQYFYFRDWRKNSETLIQSIEEKIGYPVIIKPANLGSSVGISKASNRADLEESVELAGKFAMKIIVERAITNLREINCSVIGDVINAQASVCEEPVGNDEILSYNDKYVSNSKGSSKGMSSTKRKLPADLSLEQSGQIRQMAIDTFQVLGCSGVSRIDFLMDYIEGKIYVNEINTIPGSLSFYLWEATDKPFTKMLDELIEGAFKRKRERANLMFTYTENILSLGGGLKGGKK